MPLSNKMDMGNPYNRSCITVHGGGTCTGETMIPTAPGVWFPHQPPSQWSLRHQIWGEPAGYAQKDHGYV